MTTRFNNYEYEREEIQPTGDFHDWRFRIRNLTSGNNFEYRINISDTALNSQGLPSQIQDAVDTRGESLVQEWLSNKEEGKIQCKVTSSSIDPRALGAGDPWIDWGSF